MVRVLLFLIHAYQRCISPFKPACCRYLPTCSEFAHEAVRRHGAWRGGLLALRRLLSCHPLGGHGLDPVPDDPTWLGGRRHRRDKTPGTACCQGTSKQEVAHEV